MKVVQDQALSLNKDRQIVSVKRERFVEMGLNGKYIKKFGSNLLDLAIACFLGVRFCNLVYYCMSQGLLDPKTLEQIQNKRVLDEVNMAPSYILKETW